MNGILELPEPAWVKRAELLEFAQEEHKNAMSLIESNESKNDYIQMRREMDGWSDFKVQLFSDVHREALGQYVSPEATKNRVSKDLLDLYTKDLEAMPPIARDIAMGYISAGRDLRSLLVRPWSDEMANRLNRETGMMEQAAMQADESSVTGELGRHVRGATRSLTSAAGVGAATGPAGVIGVITAQEANQAITTADDLRLTGADKWGYVGRAALIEGGVTTTLQVLGLGGFESIMGGTEQLTRAGLKEFLKRMGLNLTHEGFEEVSTEWLHEINRTTLPGQEPMSWERFKKIASDTLKQTGLAVGVGGAGHGIMAQPGLKQQDAAIEEIAKTSKISEDVVRKALLKASKKGKVDDDVFGRELIDEFTKTPAGAKQWAFKNPEKAGKLIEQDKTSRAPFKEAGLPKMSEKNRAIFLDELKKHKQELADFEKTKKDFSDQEQAEFDRESERRLRELNAAAEAATGEPEPVTETGELTERLEAEVKPEPVVEEAPQEAPQVQDVKGILRRPALNLTRRGL